MSESTHDSRKARHQRLMDLFSAAVALAPDERVAWFEREGIDPALRSALEDLLAADARLDGMTAKGAVLPVEEFVEPSRSGTRVGAYLLREEIGRGGMGAVYRAERADGSVEQQVAIKFMRRDLFDAEALRRFRQERQLVATLDHPGIARLFDAAELADGTPYFVMEYVAGVSIAEYCARGKLDLRRRVELLREVCDAVAAAHRQLIVHRDLKPGNILVTASGAPKLLDFGIAKPLDSTAVDHTATAHRFFSPQYAAPEQITGQATGVACDIYALGMLLHELLTGAPAFDFKGLHAGQIERLIIEVPPIAPSVALSKLGDALPGVRARQLRGDLDGIVAQCLRKSPRERYPSVEQLQQDLSNYLEGRPVTARGGQRWYRLRKFVGRNKIAVSAAAVAAVAVLAGFGVSVWQARIAQQRAEELEQVARFQSEMLEQMDPARAGLFLTQTVLDRLNAALDSEGLSDADRAAVVDGFSERWRQVNGADAARDLIVHSLVMPAEIEARKRFAARPELEATLLFGVAKEYYSLAMFDQANKILDQVLSTRNAIHGQDDERTIQTVQFLGDVVDMLGKPDEAERFHRQALQTSERVLGPDHPLTLEAMADVATKVGANGQGEESARMHREILARRSRMLGPEHPNVFASMHSLARQLIANAQLTEAETLLRQVLDGRRRVLGNDHADTLMSISEMGTVLVRLGRIDEALRFDRLALEERRRVLGDLHPDTLLTMNDLGFLLMMKGDLAAAESLLRETIDKRSQTIGRDHFHTMHTVNNLAMALFWQGRANEAQPLAQEVLGLLREKMGEDAVRTSGARMNLGQIEMGLGHLDVAEAHILEARRRIAATLGEAHPEWLKSGLYLGMLRVAQGRNADAIAELEAIEAPVRAAFPGSNASRTANLLTNIGRAKTALGEFDDAERRLLEANKIFQEAPGPNPKDSQDCRRALVALYEAWHRHQPDGGHEASAAKWRTAVPTAD